ncbi:MAG: Succinate dehydrogenase cytochrome b556 subunit [Paracidovorax wautersii]|uniref:Succinate dehydrogenase cytochrome b556 subunit n=1 Tax=Paracidovorax wautersii TaxID=1177982 RepID=A0A7V8JPP4_9BURK|nr:MAG: Succinate dehydrogenase cytochrome b556 subunit [Paracidovorax wautersii]
MKPSQPPRREHRNIALTELLPYMARFPAPAWVSLLHRVSGILLFLLLPAVLWAFDASLFSETTFSTVKNVFEHGIGWIPGWLLKLAIVALLWAFLHHLIAGLRFLALDVSHHLTEKRKSARSARWVLILSFALTLVFGAKIFGLY